MQDKVIVLGDKRIPISTIKQYGIATRDVYYKKIFERTGKPGVFRDNFHYEWHGEKVEVTKTYAWLSRKKLLCRTEDGVEIFASEKHINEPHLIVEKEKYMYVETYKGNVWNYAESKAPFDIEEKCKEIDELFNGN